MKQDGKSLKKEALSLIARVLLAALAGWIVMTQVFLATRVNGYALSPDLKDGDVILGFRLRAEQAADGEAVVYRDGQTTRIGRVMAKSGDIVDVTDTGKVVVNGSVREERLGETTMTLPYRMPEERLLVRIGEGETEVISHEQVEARLIALFRRRGL